MVDDWIIFGLRLWIYLKDLFDTDVDEPEYPNDGVSVDINVWSKSLGRRAVSAAIRLSCQEVFSSL